MALFQKHFERWAKVCPLGKEKVLSADCSRCRLVPAASGAQNVAMPLEGGERFLHSPIDPVKEAKLAFESLSLKHADTLYIYGVGLGYFYDAAKEWLHEKPQRSLVFLETRPEAIRCFLETEQAGPLLFDPQVALYLFDEMNPALYRLDKIVYLYASARPTEYAMTALPAYILLQPTAVNEFAMKISFFHSMYVAGLSESQSINTPFFRNFFWNALYLPSSYYFLGLKDQFAGIPAIICGAGPSLDKNIDQLRLLGDRALIFAGGTALNALNAKRVMPHFGVGIDPNFAQFTRAVAHDAFEIPFFYRTRFLHEALEIVQGEKVYVPGNAGYEVGKWMEKQLGLSTSIEISEGFNVLNFTLGLAYLLGCNPLICVGIDLAYTDRRSYPSGLVPHPIHDQKATFKTKGVEEEVVSRKDIYGNQVLTLWKWVAEALWYQNFSTGHPDRLLINCTEGGIGFGSVPNHPLSQVVEQHLQKRYDFGGLIHGVMQNSAFPENVSLETIREIFQRLMESLKQAQQLIRELFKQEKTAAFEDVLRKLKEEEGFQAILKPYYEQLQQKGSLARMRKAANEESKEALPSTQEEYLESADYKVLNDAARIQGELIQKIFDYFDATRTPMRAWEAEHPEQIEALRSEYRQAIHPLPGTLYRFEEGVLMLADPELQLNYSEPVLPDPIKSYYPSGALKTEQHYKAGRLHGPSLFYTENGALLARSWFLEGSQEGRAETYYPDGSPHSLQRFRHGKREGSQLYFYRNGLPRSHLHYREGILEGEVKLYHPQGMLKRSLRFLQGKRHGKEEIWDLRGIKRIDAEFDQGRPIGNARIWHYNGVLAKEIAYDSESHCLTVKQWDERGNEIPVTGEADYFVHASLEAEKLTASLNKMVNELSQAWSLLPLSQSPKQGREECVLELEQLYREAEHLEQLGDQLKKTASGENENEALWKSKRMQRDIEKQIGSMSAEIQKNIEHLGQAMKELTKRIKKDGG
jgi:antitoxin component YwqK of YwqJK toxin-antitoxin module